jgi:shikimate dehydrogenase
LRDSKLYGLIGNPLSHSFSEQYFHEKFAKESIADSEYRNFPLESIEQLIDLVNNNPCLRGLNVTIPYKEQVVQYIDDLDDISTQLQAVNTIKITRIGNTPHYAGYNTDVYGFRESLLPCLEKTDKTAIVLGTGGASKAVCFVLEQIGIDPLMVSRNPLKDEEVSYDRLDAEMIRNSRIIINTTPVGMYPNTNDCPEIDYDSITGDHLLYDLIYNPAITRFLEHGRKAGATIINGKKMLELQAEKAWEIWND